MNQSIKEELLQLFNSLRSNKSSQTPVQKSTLISLLVYHKIDSQYSQYFRYVSRQLQKLNKTMITQSQFLKIFMNPQMDLQTAENQQLADVFSILDVKKQGSIQLNDFLEMYRQSQNYKRLQPQQKRQAQDQIKDAFFSVSQNGTITPMQFYNVVKFK